MGLKVGSNKLQLAFYSFLNIKPVYSRNKHDVFLLSPCYTLQYVLVALAIWQCV